MKYTTIKSFRLNDNDLATFNEASALLSHKIGCEATDSMVFRAAIHWYLDSLKSCSDGELIL